MFIDIKDSSIYLHKTRSLTEEEIMDFLYKSYHIITSKVNENMLMLMSNIDENKKRILQERGMRLI